MKNIKFLRHAQSGGKRMGGIVGIRKVCHVGENARDDSPLSRPPSLSATSSLLYPSISFLRLWKAWRIRC